MSHRHPLNTGAGTHIRPSTYNAFTAIFTSAAQSNDIFSAPTSAAAQSARTLVGAADFPVAPNRHRGSLGISEHTTDLSRGGASRASARDAVSFGGLPLQALDGAAHDG